MLRSIIEKIEQQEKHLRTNDSRPQSQRYILHPTAFPENITIRDAEKQFLFSLISRFKDTIFARYRFSKDTFGVGINNLIWVFKENWVYYKFVNTQGEILYILKKFL